jgi:hypothetical protein
MLEFLKSADDVMAMKIGGKLSAAELETLVGRVESELEARDKTHMYMEVKDFSGFDVPAFARYLPHGLAMLGKLGRFGRIAVVADQGWVRWWTRIESALLPGISYEVFMPDRRDVALDWVEGRRAEPHDPAIRIIETDDPAVLAFEVDGKIRVEDIDSAASYFLTAFTDRQPVRILGRIKRLEGFEPGAAFSSDYIRMKLRALKCVDRYAIVGGPDWLRSWVGLVDPLVRMEVRHFAAEEEGLAWLWLGAHAKAERSRAA